MTNKETQIELVQEIVKQGILARNKKIADVHINYGGAWDTLCVTGYPYRTDYSEGKQAHLFRHSMTQLDDTETLTQALNDINKLWSEKK